MSLLSVDATGLLQAHAPEAGVACTPVAMCDCYSNALFGVVSEYFVFA
jgi:hypothetical protein